MARVGGKALALQFSRSRPAVDQYGDVPTSPKFPTDAGCECFAWLNTLFEMSACGTERTNSIAAVMSANDPKQTFV